MVNIEKISASAMEVITYSGMAKSCYMEALALAKEGKFSEADKKLGCAAGRGELGGTADQPSDDSCGGSADGGGDIEDSHS